MRRYWAAIDNKKIYGVGDSQLNALHDAETLSGRVCETTVPCTPAAYSHIIENGTDDRVICDGSSVALISEAQVQLDLPWRSEEETGQYLKLLRLRKAVCDALIQYIDTMGAQGTIPPEMHEVEHLLAAVMRQEKRVNGDLAATARS